jgi:ABC-type arginine transport system permease subunit
VALTLLLARGALHTAALLLSGVVVGVLLGAVADLVTMARRRRCAASRPSCSAPPASWAGQRWR